jgi:hypothetical protein
MTLNKTMHMLIKVIVRLIGHTDTFTASPVHCEGKSELSRLSKFTAYDFYSVALYGNIDSAGL